MTMNAFGNSYPVSEMFLKQDEIPGSYLQEVHGYSFLVKEAAKSVCDSQTMEINLRDRLRLTKDEHRKRILKRQIRFNRRNTKRVLEKLEDLKTLFDEAELDYETLINKK